MVQKHAPTLVFPLVMTILPLALVFLTHRSGFYLLTSFLAKGTVPFFELDIDPELSMALGSDPMWHLLVILPEIGTWIFTLVSPLLPQLASK